MCSSGAFKTLDKDNNGTIDLDIKEVRLLKHCVWNVQLNDQNHTCLWGLGLGVVHIMCIKHC